MKNKIISAEEAARLVLDGDVVTTGGFVGIGFPEELAIAIEAKYLRTGSPKNLTLLYAAGQGDGKKRGLNHFSHEGMVRRVVGGHWGLVPKLGEMALENQIEAYNFPQGAISHLFRDIAAGKPGTITKVGLQTFVDPRLEGGKMNEMTQEDLVELITLRGEEYLFYKAFPINVALLRGTTADAYGNITMEKEALVLESLAIAQAVKNSGGIVIVQVERTTVRHQVNPKMVAIPSVLVDAVVVAQPENHHQTFSEVYNPAYTGEITVSNEMIPKMPLNERKVIARRASMFLKINSVVNLGIGMPEGIASVANEENTLEYITPTVEPGAIGGIPAGGLSFGAVTNPHAIITQPSQFDFYDGGGLDQAFLGMAEVDEEGNVNVSRFGKKLAGAGGFINISQNAKAVYFMGTFAARAEVEVRDGAVRVVRESDKTKFVKQVGQITFNGKYARQQGQTVYYITERCVFELRENGLTLIEIANGMDLERDILGNMHFRPQIADDLKPMDARIFKPELMNLRKEEKVSLEDRLLYEAETNTLNLNLEGLSIYTEAELDTIEQFFEQRLSAFGKKVNVIVNYDNFFVSKAVEGRYFAMVKRHNEQYFLSSTRYSTDPFFRRHAGTKFAQINSRLYASGEEAQEHL